MEKERGGGLGREGERGVRWRGRKRGVGKRDGM